MEMDDQEIDGHKSTGDPLKNFYSEILTKLREISWEDFENLTESSLREVGFYEVHRLSRGSQQGKDIIGTWISRFTYGRELKFRFQCKHSIREKALKKTDVGDAITDFLSQEKDEILIIVTNCALSNDLIESLDKLASKGVFALNSTRAVRFFSGCKNILAEYIDIHDIPFQEYRNYFDSKSWFESLLSLKEEKDLIYNLNRYWTEPYTWFFHKNETNSIQRMWTTDGGDFCLSVHNQTSNLIDLSGLKIVFISKDELPEFGILNTTPKGSHDIPIFEVELSNKFEEIPLVDEENKLLKPDSQYFCLIDFKGIDPGIYHFQFRDSGNLGSRFLRESQVYSIAFIPEKLPEGYIHIHESWPQSLLLIEEIFQLTESDRKDFLSLCNGGCLLFRDTDGQVYMKYPSRNGKKKGFVPDMPGLKIENYLTKFVDAHASFDTRMKFFHLTHWRVWCEEALDHTEPRAPFRRAMRGLEKSESKELVVDSLFKAHERAPFSGIGNLLLYKAFMMMGYDGFAKFHLNLAYLNNPKDPKISAHHFKVLKKRSKDIYLERIPEEKWDEFNEEIS